MTDASDLEARLFGALDRLGAAVEALPDSTGPDLSVALDAERMANAQLEERVKAIKDKQETLVGRLEAEVASLRDALAERDATVTRMRHVNDALRDTNRALREANAAGLSDAGLIDAGARAELDALRVLREGDRAEIDEILGTLAPILEEAEHA